LDNDRLNRWLTLGANIGVLIGIILLLVELDQNRDMMRSQTRNEISVGIVDLLSQPANNVQLADLIKRVNNGEELTQQDIIQFRYRTISMFRYFENVNYQYRQGLYDEEEYATQKEAWRNYLASSDRVASNWCDYRETVSPQFRAEIDGLLAKRC